ncbi:uncharacterized protein METZ01_LOCUS464995, partial [marine metagenome]
KTEILSLDGEQLAVASVTLMIIPEHQKMKYGIVDHKE